jgi:hypothetical protein
VIETTVYSVRVPSNIFEHLKSKALFKNLIQISETKGREYSIALCKKNGQIYPGKICKGIECEVGIRGCEAGENIGSFHTHPWSAELMRSIISTIKKAVEELSEFSPTDIYSAISSGSRFECIGFTTEPMGKKKIIKCIEFLKESPSYNEMKKKVNEFEINSRTSLWSESEKIERFEKLIEEIKERLPEMSLQYEGVIND